MSPTVCQQCASAAQLFRVALGTRAGQRTLKGLSLIFTVALIAYLAQQLGEIGWRDVLGRVPRAPGFYIAFVGFYFCFPLFESVVFRLLWNCPARRSLPALLKKRVYSKYLLDYSGEAYMYLWARRHVDLPARQVLHTLKDNIIISSTSSMLVGGAVLLGLLYAGQIVLPTAMFEQDAAHLVVAALVGGAVAALVIRFRRRILSLPRRTVGILCALPRARRQAKQLVCLRRAGRSGPSQVLRRLQGGSRRGGARSQDARSVSPEGTDKTETPCAVTSLPYCAAQFRATSQSRRGKIAAGRKPEMRIPKLERQIPNPNDPMSRTRGGFGRTGRNCFGFRVLDFGFTDVPWSRRGCQAWDRAVDYVDQTFRSQRPDRRRRAHGRTEPTNGTRPPQTHRRPCSGRWYREPGQVHG